MGVTAISKVVRCYKKRISFQAITLGYKIEIKEGQKRMMTEVQYKQALSIVHQWRRQQFEIKLATMSVGEHFYLNSNGSLVAQITKQENGQFSVWKPEALDEMMMSHQSLLDRLSRAIKESLC